MRNPQSLIETMSATATDYERIGPPIFSPIAARLVEVVGLDESPQMYDDSG